jgi:hypothetical protein
MIDEHLLAGGDIKLLTHEGVDDVPRKCLCADERLERL